MTSRYTYTAESLQGRDGKINPFNCIHAISKMLKGKGLTSQSISKAMDAIKALSQYTGMEGMEALVFIPVFERDLAETSTGITDLADYFSCPVLDVMGYYSYMIDLEKNGFLTLENGLAWSPLKRRYRVNPIVLEAILQGEKVERNTKPEKQKVLDQCDFCGIVTTMVGSRKNEGMDTQELLGNIVQLEEAFLTFPMVKALREKDISIDSRALFYVICDTYTPGIDRSTDLLDVLGDLFDSSGKRLSIRSSIMRLENPLQKEGWVEGVGEHSIRLTDEGVRFFLGDMAKAFITPIENLDCYAFASEVNKIFRDADEDRPGFSEEIKKKMFRLEVANGHLPFVMKLELDYDDLDRFLFYMICYECMEDNSLALSDLSCIYPKARAVRVAHMLKAEEHPLQIGKLVECSKQGFFDNSVLTLTDEGKRLFFGDDAKNFIEKVGDRDYFLPDKIVERKLFFGTDTQSQLDLLKTSLEESNYETLRKHLEEKGMQRGIAALLYGSPGTGKTESVMQIAKTTGRAIYHVDISSTKSCWFGESEKLIKAVFKKYEDICERSERRPILLFNEADGIFSKRKDSDSSNVAQTENTIQNIILEEMERLDGILIATTNMADNLDGAFERRFLFKIKFEKPVLEARKSIWLSKMSSLSDEDAQSLAANFAFSGGEIDNIVRKAAIMEVLDGKEPCIQEINKLCREEKMHGENARIGFS